MTREPSAWIMAVIIISGVTSALNESLKFKMIGPTLGKLRGLEFGLKYSAELRKIGRERPRSDLAKRVIIIDRISLVTWVTAATTILLWHFDIVR